MTGFLAIRAPLMGLPRSQPTCRPTTPPTAAKQNIRRNLFGTPDQSYTKKIFEENQKKESEKINRYEIISIENDIPYKDNNSRITGTFKTTAAVTTTTAAAPPAKTITTTNTTTKNSIKDAVSKSNTKHKLTCEQQKGLKPYTREPTVKDTYRVCKATILRRTEITPTNVSAGRTKTCSTVSVFTTSVNDKDVATEQLLKNCKLLKPTKSIDKST